MDTNTAQAAPLIHDRRARFALPVDRDLRDCTPKIMSSVIALLQAPGDLDLGAIEIALQTLPVTEESLGDAVYQDDAAYVRTLLYRDARCELLALTWRPGQRSPLHDHGSADSVMRVVSGEATENLYRQRESGAAKREHMTRKLRAGTVTLTRADTMHAISNDGEAPLVTLHVYTPPLQR
jgi:predicted metal-dependent enzyme (double-stranded beta helix superfamily)